MSKLQDMISMSYDEGYQNGSGDTIDSFMTSLLEGYDVVEWRGKSYQVTIKEIIEGDNQHE